VQVAGAGQTGLAAVRSGECRRPLADGDADTADGSAAGRAAVGRAAVGRGCVWHELVRGRGWSVSTSKTA